MDITTKELWMLLGEKDVQIYQLLKQNNRLISENEVLVELNNVRLGGTGVDNSVRDTPDKPEGT